MAQFKKCKVVMLPSTKENIPGVYSAGQGWKLQYCNPFPNGALITLDYKPQHLYILSDEEIKKYYFKIIASDDPSLELPKIPDDFIKKYCELGGIDEVMVEWMELRSSDGWYDENEVWHWKMLFAPKLAPDNTIIIKEAKESWNRPEIESYFHKFTQDLKGKISDTDTRLLIQEFHNKWIEENL